MAHSRESDQFVNPVVNTHGTMIRIYLLGPLTVQWIDEAGKTFPFPKERLYGRGAAPALSLLKALLSQPHRFALRDWLMEQFWPATPRSKAEERLDDVASGLRTLLRPPESTAKILYYVHGGKGSSGYRLEGYPQIWVVVFLATFNTINKWALGISDTLALGLLCEYLGLKVPIVAVPCVLTDSGLDSHPAFPRSLAQLKEYGVHVIYEPEKYPPKNEVPWEVILETLHQMTK